MARVLVVDDDRSVHLMVKRSLEKMPNAPTVESCGDASAAVSLVRSFAPDCVLLDVMLPGGVTGLDILRDIQQIDSKIPIIMITGGGDSSTAIEAMQLGAYDYVNKPLDLPALNALVERALETRRMASVPVAIETAPTTEQQGDSFVGRSPQMLEVFKTIGRVAKQNVPVLIRGESGTGKELVARSLYQHSERVGMPFLAVNCAALPDTLLESELFGHEKGSFTGADRKRIGKFEQCNGGTLFLDEVGDMSGIVQGKVLRLLQDQTFERVGGNETIQTDVRIISATNRPLEDMVEAGQFREDLLYRLNGVMVQLPPLRERQGDVALLIQHYLNQLARELHRSNLEGISPEALQILQAHDWPGNVRELQAVVRRALLNTTGPVVVPDFLPPEVRKGKPRSNSRTQNTIKATTTVAATSTGPSPDLKPFIDERLTSESTNLYAEAIGFMERYVMTRVLQETGGNQTRASEILGITRGKVRDRVKQFGINLDRTVEIASGNE
ncbi:MAG: sigma-54-dependent Fis family transcriptional regulator [Rhodopirellula sp.]|nr:sigma-54-dependent Fis family transcriptional regulator [Rhodopirellula sp.]